jgi:DNA replication protein DnaC
MSEGEDFFMQVLHTVGERRAKVQAHRATCQKRPCADCGFYVCPRCKGDMLGKSGATYFVGDELRAGICEACALREERKHLLEPALSSIPKHYRWASFDNLDLIRSRVPNQHAIARAQQCFGAIRVTLIGTTGSGKTSLAVAMLRMHIDAAYAPDADADTVARGKGALFATSFDVCAAAASHPLGKGEAPLIARARRASILVLDEVGSEPQPDAVKLLLFDRYNSALPTWVTTFLSREQVSERYGGGVHRRMFEHGRTIEVSAPPLRVVS